MLGHIRPLSGIDSNASMNHFFWNQISVLPGHHPQHPCGVFFAQASTIHSSLTHFAQKYKLVIFVRTQKGSCYARLTAGFSGCHGNRNSTCIENWAAADSWVVVGFHEHIKHNNTIKNVSNFLCTCAIVTHNAIHMFLCLSGSFTQKDLLETWGNCSEI